MFFITVCSIYYNYYCHNWNIIFFVQTPTTTKSFIHIFFLFANFFTTFTHKKIHTYIFCICHKRKRQMKSWFKKKTEKKLKNIYYNLRKYNLFLKSKALKKKLLWNRKQNTATIINYPIHIYKYIYINTYLIKYIYIKYFMHSKRN